MQDRTPRAGTPETSAPGTPTPEDVGAAEELLASGFDHNADVNLAAEFQTYYDAGWDWVMDAPGLSSYDSAQLLPHRVAAGKRWLLTNPLDVLPNDNALVLTQGIAYYEGVRRAVDSFMKVPKVQRLVAALFATSVPGQRSATGEPGS